MFTLPVLCVMAVIASSSAESMSIPLYRMQSPLKHLLANSHMPRYKKIIRDLESLKSSNNTVPLFKFLDYEFYGKVLIGHPGQTFKVVFDTSWADLWVPSILCPSINLACAYRNKYDATKSSTYINPHERFVFNLGDHNLTGKIAMDLVHIGQFNITNQTFGEVEDLPWMEFFFSKADGVFGLSFDRYATHGIVPFFYNMIKQGLVTKKIFSLYLNRDPITEKGGALLLGDIDPKHYSGNLSYVRTIEKNGFWEIPVDSITVSRKGSQPAQPFCVGGCFALIDSSTNEIRGPPDDIDTINGLIGARRFLFGKFTVDCHNVNNLPHITFQIGGVSYVLRGQQYIQEMDKYLLKCYEDNEYVICSSRDVIERQDNDFIVLHNGFRHRMFKIAGRAFQCDVVAIKESLESMELRFTSKSTTESVMAEGSTRKLEGEENVLVSSALSEENQPGSSKSLGEEDVQISKLSPALPKETQPESPRSTRRRRVKKFCVYCRKFVSVLNTHLVRKHSTEDEVKTFLALPPQSKEKISQLNKIKGMGHEAYNKSLSEGDPLLVAREVQSKSPRLPCPNCKILYSKNSFRRHVKRCQRKEGIVPRHALKEAKRKLLQAGFRATKEETIKFNTNPSNPLQEVLSTMRTDDIQSVIMNDGFLVTYGNYLCNQFATEKHSASLISQKLRRLAGVFLDMKKQVSEMHQFIDIFSVDLWDLFIETVKQKAGWDERTKQFNSPSVVNHIGNDTSAAAEFAETELIRTKNEELQLSIANWIKIKERRFYTEIGKSALKESRRKQWQKNALLPLTEDIKKLNDYVEEQIKKSKTILLENYDPEEWINLNEKTMTQMIIFNRRRVGEVEKILLEDFERRRQKIQKDTEVYQSLTPLEKIRADHYERIEVRGKLNRPVSLLLTEEQINNIKIILKFREEAGVLKENVYLFAKGDSHFRASPSLRKCANECGAQRPQLLTGTSLRKHIASTCQILNMTDKDMSMLTQFLGHTDKTHRQYYRMPDTVLQLTLLSSLLSIVNEGKVPDFKGRNLEEINRVLENRASFKEVTSILRPQTDTHKGNEEIALPPETEGSIIAGPSQSRAHTPTYCGTESDSTESGSEEDFQPPPPKRKFTSTARGGITKRTWKTPEKHALRREFAEEIRTFTGPARDKVLRMTYGPATICLSAFVRYETAGEAKWTIGGAFLSRFYSVFDMEQLKVGFALTN